MIFSESLEYFPRSLTKRMIIKTSIGNITIAVTVYASTNESRFIFARIQVVQVFVALNHQFHLVMSIPLAFSSLSNDWPDSENSH